MNTWPDGTPKSTCNAFNWQSQGSRIVRDDQTFRSAHAAKAQHVVTPLTLKGISKKADDMIAQFEARRVIEMARHGGAYSKAVPGKR